MSVAEKWQQAMLLYAVAETREVYQVAVKDRLKAQVPDASSLLVAYYAKRAELLCINSRRVFLEVCHYAD